MKADGFEKLQGHVEVDETYVGGRQSMKDHYAKGTNKTIVMGMKERGGRMVAESIPDVTAATLRKRVLRTVKPGSTVSTDELHSYNLLTGDGYIHGAVNHSIKEYARGEHHTNHVESFWRLFKNSIRSTHFCYAWTGGRLGRRSSARPHAE